MNATVRNILLHSGNSGAKGTGELLRKKLVGKEITYYTIAGQPEHVTITESDIGQPKIGDYEKYDTQRQEVTHQRAWVVPIKGGMWTAYFELGTLKELETRQNFETMG